MAGGKGTRISSVASDIPKPMIKIAGKPVLEHEIECLRRQGITDIILTVGYLGHIIEDYFGDGSKQSPATGLPFGVHVEYYCEKEALGNAGALFQIKEKLIDDFLLLNGDVMFDVDLKRFISFHKKHDGLATLFTHPNNHPYDSGLLVTDTHDSVIRWYTKEEKRPEFYQNRVNAGIHIISPKLLQQDISEKKIDLDRHILKPLAGKGKLFCYDSPEYVKDMGTPERYYAICQDYSKGRIQKKNLANRQRAIFLDRDGTINKYVGFLRNIEEFELLDGVAEAVRKINASGYLAIVTTNQPVVARGEVTFQELKEIHNKMETLLGKESAYLDDIYVCPHHPHRGFPGEIPELKTVCQCRKPAPGMLLQAANDYNIDLEHSWVIGDRETDIICGIKAGCMTALIGNEDYGQDMTVSSLLEFVDYALNEDAI